MDLCKIISCALFCLLFTRVLAQSCLQLPPFGNADDNRDRITHRHQAIVTSYQFHCCGNVTEWGADVSPDGGMEDMRYTIAFQVWRPLPTVGTDGCYSLVGENTVTSAALTDGLIIETQPPHEQIRFQPNDTVGFYIESSSNNPETRGVVLHEEFFQETVWYANIDEVPVPSSSICPFPVGPQGALSTSTVLAPVISARLSTFDCSLLPSTQTTSVTQPQPTSQPISTQTTHHGETDSSSPMQPATDSGTGIPTSESDIPTYLETTGPTDSTNPLPSPPGSNGALIAGVVVLILFLLLGASVALVGVGVFRRLKGAKKAQAIGPDILLGMEDNEAYVSSALTTNTQSEGPYYSHIDESVDDGPNIDMENSSKNVCNIIMKKNEAYAGTTTEKQRGDVSEDHPYYSHINEPAEYEIIEDHVNTAAAHSNSIPTTTSEHNANRKPSLLKDEHPYYSHINEPAEYEVPIEGTTALNRPTVEIEGHGAQDNNDTGEEYNI